MIHINIRGRWGKHSQHNFCLFKISWSQKDPDHNRIDNKMSPILISYDIVWATARIPPSNEYFDFEAQPDPNKA